MRKNNLVGAVFGRLTVVADGGRCKKKNVLWRCNCTCGGTALAPASDLRLGKVRSCGCIRVERLVAMGATHHMSKTRTYRVWAGARSRCNNPKAEHWDRYGGRGIAMCAEWDSFENFYKDMGEAPAGMTLERVDNDGPYAPWNCVWASNYEQARNKANSVKLLLFGELIIQSDAHIKYAVSLTSLKLWRKLGMTDMQIQERIECLRLKRAK